nr:MAG TPA: hypothetical protein [Caudoviricetes sp.]
MKVDAKLRKIYMSTPSYRSCNFGSSFSFALS